MTLCAELLQIVAELNERAEIRGRERGERHLLVAGILDGLLGVFDQQLFRAVAHGAVDIARLAEAAALGAAAEQLKRYAVVNNGDIRHDGLFYVLRPVKVHQYTALYLVRRGRFSFIHAHVLAVVAALFFIKRRNIYATYCGKLF